MNDFKQENNIRVRFAPSPTGFLHVGGARTAIFNWLFAKNRNGKFLLRIEDTDPERSRSELSEQIIRSMDWLGMKSDEPIVYQSDRIERYREAVFELVKNKKAYYAFETSEELDTKRKESLAKKIPFKYDRAALFLTENEIKRNLAQGKPFAVRFKVPDGATEFDDIVHGKTSFQNSGIDDFVLLRSDGSPVYQIAVVVDDHDMKISHVIRGDDHLSNTPKQILIYKALGWDVPFFSHLPMILDEEKKKLSKRRNPVAVEEYKEKGYLPDALFNFLTLLGFAPTQLSLSSQEREPEGEVIKRDLTSPLIPLLKGEGDKKWEIIPRDELVKIFTFDRVNKSSAVFDMKKLAWLNSEYIRKTDEKVIAEMIKEKLSASAALVGTTRELSANNLSSDNDSMMTGLDLSLQYIIKVVRLTKERVSTINDFYELGKYFFTEPVSYDEKGIAKYLNEETKALMREYLEVLNAERHEGQWGSKELEEQLRSFAESKKIKAGQLIHPLRLALTGVTVSPGIFELMEVLGKEKVLRRIEKFS
jgi:glutamyl-tRNA synthetase